MENVVKYQSGNAFQRFLDGLLGSILAICIVVAVIVAVVLACKLAFAAFMLLPEGIRAPIFVVAGCTLVAVILWKLREVIAMFAFVCALFS